MQSGSKPELFIGLVGSLGTNLDNICDVFVASLKRVKYSSEKIVISDSFLEISGLKCAVDGSSESARIRSSMNVGDELRNKMGAETAAILAMIQIRLSRKSKTGNLEKPFSGNAYIIKSLKHEKEVKQLRNTYGESFWLVSVYLPLKDRTKLLEEDGVFGADDLLRRDDYGKKSHGQNVRDTFPMADFFVDASDKRNVQKQIDRFVDLIFGHPFHTPYRDEYGMFHASASSLRSSSLSRQVGAAILDRNGNLISTGTNEVPRPLGGVYEEGEKNDHREFSRGYDSNHTEKIRLLRDMLERLQDEGWLSEKFHGKGISEITDKLTQDQLKAMRIMDITEYGREVHAEMHALVSAARGNVSVDRCTMYCTTFPCHMCAKHIVSSGIDTLVFIEPYPKSHARKLFDDSISVETKEKDKVYFKPYLGISPSRYMDLFRKVTRKDGKTGKAIQWNPADATMRFWKSHDLGDEKIDLANFRRMMKKNGLGLKNK